MIPYVLWICQAPGNIYVLVSVIMVLKMSHNTTVVLNIFESMFCCCW